MIGSLLKTERLILRPLAPEDAPRLLEYVQENQNWLAPWEPAHPVSYFTEEGQRNILQQCHEERRAHGGVLFGIFERAGEPQKIIGRISISGIMRGIWQNGFVGYSIAGDMAGRGYMTEALNRVVGFGLQELRLHRLQASIIPRNSASLRVVEKCHFRYEGRALRYLKINEIWEDHELFALTEEDLNLVSSDQVGAYPPHQSPGVR